MDTSLMDRDEMIEIADQLLEDYRYENGEDEYYSLLQDTLGLAPDEYIDDLDDDSLRDLLENYLNGDGISGYKIPDQNMIDHIAYSSKTYEMITDTKLEICDYYDRNNKIVINLSKLTPEILEKLI